MAIYPDAFSLDGKIAVITGAAMGIGRAIATALAGAGAGIVGVDVDEDGVSKLAEEIRSTGGNVHALKVDVTDRTAIERTATEVVRRFGRVDILVNSAGVTKRCPAVAFPEAEWDRIVAINLKGTFLCCQAFGREMVACGEGRIVNLASIGGLVGYPETIAYLSSKGGVVQLTRGLAAEWGPHGVGVNAIAPGVVMTPMQERLRYEDPAKFDTFLARMPIAVPSRPEDIAAAALFLCAPASRLVTGHVLPVDGGYLAQ